MVGPGGHGKDDQISVYDELPWLNLYDEGRPGALELDDESMLSAFRRTATRVPDRTATLYFDTPVSYASSTA